ncbi:2-iminoacetate synthase ThiH [Leptospira yasudae]|uniref:2-iminoacetate synthase ThiH n=1 Tax=Leptospira yasudae TaxID=2202201 RepID=A0A6N4QGU7_9LEPT|nr:2-iminoacetate synthase ThiH [Leptospira yasudae]TGL78754.1 2-iminoacetate synthase ThiH [Leptospira yasudae]TGL79003.1 2-iminoacetate synthase ThiH [Leptospira yasudae]TGL82899.1 2-iminoacetate synthase ThiH [Leptospira yasudae]
MYTDLFDGTSFEDAVEIVRSKTKNDVESALHKSSSGQSVTFEDYVSLISPAASGYLEPMAILSKQIKKERFGNTIQLYMPLYLSNECRSSCLYCGFSYENKIPRKTLSEEEIEREARILKLKGIRHLVVLTGEDYSKTNLEYIRNAVSILKKSFDSIAIEIYPLDQEPYESLIGSGAEALVVYQETYDPIVYAENHYRGIKKNMRYRLEAPDRGGKAGFRRIGLGALLGLSNPLGELYKLGEHAKYLMKEYWRTSFQVSLPRMRPAAGDFQKIIPIGDKDFVRYLFAFRISFPDVGLVLSTRESQKLRDHLCELGITHMSVESKTEPGGYSDSGALKQFEIEDNRTIPELVTTLRARGLDPVFKDFDRALLE